MKLKLVKAERPTDDAIRAPKNFGWPLAFLPRLDADAVFYGLAHWSCASASSNEYWMRRDGEMLKVRFNTNGGYPEELRAFDRLIPMREIKKQFRGKTRP